MDTTELYREILSFEQQTPILRQATLDAQAPVAAAQKAVEKAQAGVAEVEAALAAVAAEAAVLQEAYNQDPSQPNRAALQRVLLPDERRLEAAKQKLAEAEKKLEDANDAAAIAKARQLQHEGAVIGVYAAIAPQVERLRAAIEEFVTAATEAEERKQTADTEFERLFKELGVRKFAGSRVRDCGDPLAALKYRRLRGSRALRALMGVKSWTTFMEQVEVKDILHNIYDTNG